MLYLYTSAMPGAPALSETAGTIINVLDACLVTGFNLQPIASISVTAGVATATVTLGHGLVRPVRCKISGHPTLNGLYPVTGTPSATQFTFSVAVPDGSYPGGSVSVAPAGWEKLFPDTQKAVYRSLDTLSTQTYWRVRQSGYDTLVCGFETMSDADTGTGPVTVPSTLAPDGYRFRHGRPGETTPRPWWIIATEKMVTIYVARYYADETILAACNGTMFGDPTPYFAGDLHCAFAVSNDNISDPPAFNSAPLINTGTTVTMRRQYGGAAGAITGLVNTIFPHGAGSDYVGSDRMINAVENRLILSPVLVGDLVLGGVSFLPRGVVPHLLYCGVSFPTDSYFPTASVTPGDAGSALEGHNLYAINIGRNVDPSSTNMNRRRVFVDLGDLWA